MVEEAKKRNMRLWFDDNGGYPSGFAGGKSTTKRRDLRRPWPPQRGPSPTAGDVAAYQPDAQTVRAGCK